MLNLQVHKSKEFGADSVEVEVKNLNRAQKEENYEIWFSAGKLYSTKAVAKDLGFKSEMQLYSILQECKVLYKKDNCYVPYANYDYLVKNSYVFYNTSKFGRTLKWTEDGRAWLINFLANKGEVCKKEVCNTTLNVK